MLYMFDRELKRQSHGHYVKSQFEELWTLFLILSFIGMVGIVIWGSNGIEYYLQNWQYLAQDLNR